MQPQQNMNTQRKSSYSTLTPVLTFLCTKKQQRIKHLTEVVESKAQPEAALKLSVSEGVTCRGFNGGVSPH